jgi:hypothetical protein
MTCRVLQQGSPIAASVQCKSTETAWETLWSFQSHGLRSLRKLSEVLMSLCVVLLQEHGFVLLALLLTAFVHYWYAAV